MNIKKNRKQIFFQKIFLFSLFFFLFSFISSGKGNQIKKGDPFPIRHPSQNKSYVQPLPKELSVNDDLEVNPIKDHEFNLEAYNNCGKARVLKLNKSLMRCQFLEKKLYQIETYICDKKKTICYFEQHKILIKNSDDLNKKKGRSFWNYLKGLFS